MDGSNFMSVGRMELLTSQNYVVWSMKMTALLRSKKLFKLIIEDEIPPECNDMKQPEYLERKNWEEKNDETFSLIIMTLSSELVGMFVGEVLAKKVWDELNIMYGGHNEDKIIDLNIEIKNLKMGHHENVDTYMTRAKNLIARLKSIGGQISVRECVYHIVRGINTRLENIAVVLRSRREATMDEIYQCLREEESRLGLNRGGFGQENSGAEKAYRANNKSKHRDKGKGQGKECYVCKKYGHIARDCWYRYDLNHGKRISRDLRENVNKNNDKGKHGAKYANSGEKENAFGAENKIRRNGKDNQEDDLIWNLDSGSTSHMTNRSDCMINMEDYDGEINIAERGRYIKATAKGDIKMRIETNGKSNLVRMRDVLLVPQLKTNLLSVRSLVKHHNEVVFNSEGASIYNSDGELIGRAKEENNMYIMNAILVKEENGLICKSKEDQDEQINVINKEKSNDNESRKIEKKNNGKIWHNRLGHLNNQYMEKMKNESMVRGLIYTGKYKDDCESCIMGKQSQKPFKSILNRQTDDKMQLIHVDLCGPMPYDSIGGNKYIFVIVDDYTRRIFVSFLKDKSETFDKFRIFKNRYEKQTDRKIKKIRSDNGTEFTNHIFENYFYDEGIKHERTVAYNPSSNGVAERANRSLIEKARTMLIESKLPLNFWGEAVATAAYLMNRTYHHGNKNKTPIEMWTGHKPTVEYLKKFGCVAYNYIPKIERNKLQPKALQGIFVGYSEYKKAYRIYLPETKKIKEGRTVTFREAVNGIDLLRDRETQNEDLENLKYIDIIDIAEPKKNIIVGDRDNLTEINGQGENHNDLEDENNLIVNDEREVSRRRGRPIGSIREVNEETRRNMQREREEHFIEMGVRRSERIKDKNQANVTEEIEEEIPQTYKEAMESKNNRQWKKAMEEEIKSLEKHKVWKVIDRIGISGKILYSKWIYNVKDDHLAEAGKKRYKARLVVAGCNQHQGIDYQESYSPVLKTETLRILISLAAMESLQIKRYDVKTAYLYSHLSEVVYMHQPDGLEIGRNKVLKVERSLYGLPQSGRNWNKKLDSVLKEGGFEEMKTDPCVYRFTTDEGYVILGIYVDDCIAFGTSNELIDKAMKTIKEKFEIREEEGPGHFLGVEIMEREEGFYLIQKKQIEKILHKYGMKDCKPVMTPADINQNLDVHEYSPPVNIKEYQELIGSLLYISCGTRPDITYIVNKLSQYTKNPKEMHMVACKRIIRYLKGTKEHSIRYGREKGVLNAVSDASWSDSKDAKSHSGYCVKIGESTVTWKMKKQDIVALSTCEAEVIAMCEAVKETKWVRNFLTELNVTENVKRPICLQSDSQSGMDWAKGKCIHQRTKHFNRKYYFVKDEIDEGEFEVRYISTKEMEADILTKTVSREKLELCKKKIGLGDHVSEIRSKVTRKEGIDDVRI